MKKEIKDYTGKSKRPNVIKSFKIGKTLWEVKKRKHDPKDRENGECFLVFKNNKFYGFEGRFLGFETLSGACYVILNQYAINE